MSYEVDVEEAKSRLGRLQEGGWFTLKSGDNHLRFLPPWHPDVKRFYFECVVHFNVGGTMVLCPLRTPVYDSETKVTKTKGDKCYVCEMIEKFEAAEDAESKKRAERIAPKLRIFYNVLDLNNKAKGCQVLASGPQIFEQLLGYFVDPAWGNFTDPDKGYNLTINRSGQGLSTEYLVRPDRDVTTLEDRNVLQNLRDLSKCVQERKYDEVKALFHGGTPEPQSGVSSTAAPSEVSTGAPPSTKPRCFGEYDEGDNICERCRSKVDCKVEKAGETKTEGPTEKPKCFENVKFFDAVSGSCKACPAYEPCAVAIKQSMR